MRLDLTRLVDWDICYFGYEREVTALIARLVRPGHAAIDVGANTGLHSLVMARSAAPGVVVACEPNPDLGPLLAHNVALNDLDNVLIEPVAVNARPGSTILYVPTDPTHDGGSSLHPTMHHHLASRRAISVQGATLDELVDRFNLLSVDLVKVDVEGLEGSVLAGAQSLLEKQSPALVFEYTRTWWKTAGYELGQVIDGLKSHGYGGFFQIGWRGPAPMPRHVPNRMNILAVKGPWPLHPHS
jgi:FkbM family methyltransferase